MTNRSRAFWAGTALVTSLAMSTAVYAQETTSAIRGTVATADGLPISGASIRVVHEPSGTTTTTLTGSDGVFDARGLRVGGPYTVSVGAEGYAADSLDGVIIGAGDTLRLNFDLESASAVDDIVVIGARDVTANNTGVSSTLDADDIAGVVSINRDIRDLARRNILVSSNARDNGGISIAGSNPRTNRVSIDGIAAQDEFGLNGGGLPTRRGPVSLDAVEQFTVSAVPVDVENGDFNGGALDVVLKSGGNDFHGTAFVNYLNDGLVGDSIRGANIPSQVTQTNYGFFVSGPLWQDRLFFSSSYEFYESVDQTAIGPAGAGFSNSIIGITQANIDSFINDFNTIYASDFPIGNIDRTKPILDEKYTVKLDWNITDNQRLSATYRNAESSLTAGGGNRTSLSTTTAALSSQWYVTGENDEAYAVELNSNWTNSLSSQIRYSERNYVRLQQPPGGQIFSDVTVCGDLNRTITNNVITSCTPTSQYRFGPDLNRHANYLETSNKTLLAKAEYALGDNLFKIGYQGQEIEVFNIFVPNSRGTYYFDSLTDFRTGQASRLVYTNAITGNANDAAAVFKYRLNSVFAQDTLELTPSLTIQAGVRYDWYSSDAKPAYNANFVARNGFSNQSTYDGMEILMPRVSVEWDTTDWLTINGGVGLFSGGLPDVLLSNVFSVTGVLTSGIQIERNADGTFRETTGVAGFTPAIGAAALNLNLADPRTFYDIPAAVRALQGGAVASPVSEVNAFSPSYELPSDWRYFLNATVEAPEGWASGFLPEYASHALDNWRLSFDAVFTEANKSVVFRDTRSQVLRVNGVAQFTPDGRVRYDGVTGTTAQRTAFGITSTNPGSLRDIVAFNGNEGESYTLGVSASRSFDNGLDVLVGYAFQQNDDQTASLRNGTTAGGLYGNGVSRFDPNIEDYGTSSEEIQNRFKAELNYRHNFFGDYETRFNLFGEIRDGRPISFTMGDGTSPRSPTFGVNRGGQLLYVPDFGNDANPNDLQVGNVFFIDATTRDRFRALVDTFGLPYGRVLQKGEGTDDQPEIYQLDFQFSQELPVAFLPGRLRFTADVQNVANLLNDEWGIIEEYGNLETQNLITARCADASGVVAPTGSPVCTTYQYSTPSPTADVIGRNQSASLWAIQLGLRYSF
ncbi:TonB-dependent receptor [Brevundimonas sp. AJA228-03]|uniref:TonB-dependent receptor n=1 Tax=Brevundimonas sp. AJA228-03 TaxID=2752515 RepID=UPI001ADF4A9C|nr:TonB-dependent receptor [Brevundimonas sp. AJA228-03]QTN19634.1 TonB-dependent receptor [Brevundimonas sp. AJA228-03]